MSRIGRVERVTKETKIVVEIDLDGTGTTDVATGVRFYDHMLDALGKHGAFDLTVRAEGDTDIDAHHTVEDVAIALGQALHQALGDKKGIRRFGDAMIPMDEALAQAVVDVSGRPYMVHTGEPEMMTRLRRRRALPDGAQQARVRDARHARPARPAHPGVRRPRPAPRHRGAVQGRRSRAAGGGGADPRMPGPVDEGCAVTGGAPDRTKRRAS